MIKIISFITLLMTGFVFPQQLIWNHTGGPMGGVIGDLAINSKGSIFAGAYPISQNGLFKSTDNGNNWNRIETQFGDLAVYSIYITDEDHIWVGTDFQDRIYLSTDDGKTWEAKSDGYVTGECWAFGESKDGVIFAGDGQYGKLYRSTNYGDYWEYSANLNPLVFATHSNNIVFAGTFSGLYSTIDNGINWLPVNFLQNIPVSTIVMDSLNNIYCGTGYYDNGDGVYFSSNSGQSWSHLGLEGKVVLSLAFDSEGNLYAGTQSDGLFKTTNQGQTWQQFQNGLHRKAVARLKINNKDHIFIGSEGEDLNGFNEGGVYRSTNSGYSYEQIGLPISGVNNIGFYGDSLIFSSTPSGVQVFNIHKNQWNNLGLFKVEAITITPSGYIYAATKDEGLYKSTDLGKNWLLTKLSLKNLYNVLAINDDTIFTSSSNLVKSIDGGETWDLIPIVTGSFSHGLFFKEKNLFATGYISNNRVLFRSTNNGVSFDTLLSGFRTWNSNNPIASTNNNFIYLASRDDNLDGILRSTDNGSNWEQALNITNCNSTIYADDNGTVITGNIAMSVFDSIKIYISYNFGKTWNTFIHNENILNNISDIKKINSGYYYISTFNSGIYEVVIPTYINEEKEYYNNTYLLSQNYPNPFNPETKIIYQIQERGFVSLKVYDMLGREVADLVNEERLPGEYSVVFNAGSLASGVYIYSLRVNDFMQNKKMTLLK